MTGAFIEPVPYLSCRFWLRARGIFLREMPPARMELRGLRIVDRYGRTGFNGSWPGLYLNVLGTPADTTLFRLDPAGEIAWPS
jgi:hypothetical protein